MQGLHGIASRWINRVLRVTDGELVVTISSETWDVVNKEECAADATAAPPANANNNNSSSTNNNTDTNTSKSGEYRERGLL